MVYHLFKLKVKIEKLINKKFINEDFACEYINCSSLLSVPTLVTKGNTHFKHMLEWNYFVGVILFYLLSNFSGEEPHKFLGFRPKFGSSL